jgi:hypothetical protein
MARIAAFAGSARPQGLHALEATALAQLDALRQATTRGLNSALRSRKRLVVSANLAGPAILVPESFSAPDSRALVLRLADVQVGSKRAADTARPEAAEAAAAAVRVAEPQLDDAAALYDRFDVKLSGLSVVCGRADATWRRSGTASDAAHLVEEFGIDLAVESCAIVHLSHPRLRVRANLPSLQVDAAYEKLSHTIAVANGWINSFARASPPPPPSAVLQGPIEPPELEGVAAIAVAAARVEREQAQSGAREAVSRSWETVGTDRMASRVQQLAAAVLLDAEFTLAHVRIVVRRAGQDLFSAAVLGLSAGVVQRQFDRRLRMALGGILLKDCAGAAPEKARLVYAGASGDVQADSADAPLLSAQVEQVDETAPDFVGLNRPLTSITADIARITVVVQPKVLGSIMAIATDIGQYVFL